MHNGNGIRRYDAEDFRALGARGLDGRVHAQAVERVFGRVRVVRVQGGGLELETQGPGEGPEMLDFVFLDEGQFSYREGREWIRLKARFLIVSEEVKRRVRLAGRWRLALVQVPREAMEGFVAELPQRIDQVERRSMLDLSMQAFVVTMLQHDREATAIENYAAEQLLLEMSGAVLLDRCSGAGVERGSPRAVLRDRAMAVIAQQCADVELNPERVAREVRTSLRQLQVVFAEIGTTVAGEIRRRRTRLASALLTDSRYDVLTIDHIAERSGFGTTMSMRRALQEAFGAGPRELRSRRDESRPSGPVAGAPSGVES